MIGTYSGGEGGAVSPLQQLVHHQVGALPAHARPAQRPSHHQEGGGEHHEQDQETGGGTEKGMTLT